MKRGFVVAAALFVAVSGCGRARAVSTAPPPPSASVDAVYDPPIMSDMTSLALISSRTGVMTTTVRVPAGSLWIVVSCTGGSLTVDVKDIDSQPYDCGSTGVGLFDGEIEMPAAQDVTVTVRPDSPAVRWGVRVGHSR